MTSGIPNGIGGLPAEKALCECGHSQRHHYYDNTSVHARTGMGRCHASVIDTVPMGFTATMCKCKAFEEPAK